MAIGLLLTIYCICVAAASLVGGALPGLVRLTHRRMQLVMSFVGGLMLGVALLHLVPHAFHELHSIDRLAAWMLAGLIAMFMLIRVFHVHAHEHGDTSDVAAPHEHAGACEHHHAAHDAAGAQHPFSWFGLAAGLALHTLIDGLALGAAVIAEAHEQHGFALFGFGTFLAVALHKPLDALSITSLMAAGGWSPNAVRLANIAFSVLCPLGAMASVWGLSGSPGGGVLLGAALAFTAGVFLCIALADLLPEVTFHAHDRLPLTCALLLGITLAWAIGFLEPAHIHRHEPTNITAHPATGFARAS